MLNRTSSICARQSAPLYAQVRLRKYFRYFWSHPMHTSPEETEVLSCLTESLHDEVMMTVHEKTILKMPLFQIWADDHSGCMLLLFSALRPLFVMDNDVIIEQAPPHHPTRPLHCVLPLSRTPPPRHRLSLQPRLLSSPQLPLPTTMSSHTHIHLFPLPSSLLKLLTPSPLGE